MNVIILFIIPILAIMNMMFMNSENDESLNKCGLAWSMTQTLLFCSFIMSFSSFNTFNFHFMTNWLDNMELFSLWGSTMFIMDGISVFFMGLSMLLMPICMLISWKAMDKLKKEFMISLFSVLLFLMGVFTIMDLLGFYMLFETMLIPMFLIMGMWGSSEEKVKAAYYFFFYTLIGSLLMLLSMFKIYSLTGTTNYFSLMNMELPTNLQYWLFMGFFSSLAVKIPMFPTHIWLPQAHVEAPMSGSVLLAGMLLKLGGYGFISFSNPLFPLASEYFTPIMLTLSLMAIIYGAFTTCMQTDMKSLMAYSSVSHMGLVTLAMFVHSFEGLMASVMMMLAHGLVSSGLFMTSAVLYTSFHTSAMKYFKGLTVTMPVLSTMTFMLMLGNISFPGTLNFIAEFSSLLVATSYSLVVGVGVCVGMMMGTVYSLYVYNSMYFGSITQSLFFSSDMSSFEFNSFIPLLMLTMFLGMIPNYLIYSFLTSLFMNISL